MIELLISGTDLTSSQSEAAMEGLLGGADATQIGAFLVLLRAKGETAEEVGMGRGGVGWDGMGWDGMGWEAEDSVGTVSNPSPFQNGICKVTPQAIRAPAY